MPNTSCECMETKLIISVINYTYYLYVVKHEI